MAYIVRPDKKKQPQDGTAPAAAPAAGSSTVAPAQPAAPRRFVTLGERFQANPGAKVQAEAFAKDLEKSYKTGGEKKETAKGEFATNVTKQLTPAAGSLTVPTYTGPASYADLAGYKEGQKAQETAGRTATAAAGTPTGLGSFGALAPTGRDAALLGRGYDFRGLAQRFGATPAVTPEQALQESQGIIGKAAETAGTAVTESRLAQEGEDARNLGRQQILDTADSADTQDWTAALNTALGARTERLPGEYVAPGVRGPAGGGSRTVGGVTQSDVADVMGELQQGEKADLWAAGQRGDREEVERLLGIARDRGAARRSAAERAGMASGPQAPYQGVNPNYRRGTGATPYAYSR